MIHVFRVFENEPGDFLEFDDKQALMTQFYRDRNLGLYDWQLVEIEQALAMEQRPDYQKTLTRMQANGDRTVVLVCRRGQRDWFSLSEHGERGIPAVHKVALAFYTDPAQDYRVTTQHHQVFEVIKEERFQGFRHQVIESVLNRVRGTRCEHKLDRYVDINLKKLKDYGVHRQAFNGSYVQIKDQVKQVGIACPFFGDFFFQLMDVSMEKEQQLLGKNRIHAKQF